MLGQLPPIDRNRGSGRGVSGSFGQRGGGVFRGLAGALEIDIVDNLTRSTRSALPYQGEFIDEGSGTFPGLLKIQSWERDGGDVCCRGARQPAYRMFPALLSSGALPQE